MTNNDIIAGIVLQTVGKEAVLNQAATVYTPALPSTTPKTLETNRFLVLPWCCTSCMIQSVNANY